MFQRMQKTPRDEGDYIGERDSCDVEDGESRVVSRIDVGL